MKRREFLKFSTAFGASLKAGEVGLMQKTIFDDDKKLSANRFGAFYANLNSGKIVSTDAFEGDEKANTMNLSIPDLLQNESRVLYPCVRKSYLQKHAPNRADLRGKEEFVRVSWDEAITLAAKALKDNFDKYGPESIYGECYWWGGCGKVSWGRAVAHRMLKILGGYVEESGDYSTGAGLVIMPYIFGSNMVYDAPTRWEAIIKECKNIVFWGTDPLITNQISSTTPTHSNYKYFTKIKELKEAGKISITSIDVYKNDTARYCNSDFISIVPNTDTALMIGMCHYLYSNDLYNKEFIKKYTVGFNKFKKYLLGEEDKVVKDIFWASSICKIPQDVIKNLCEKLVKDNSIIIAGRALQRQDHGEQSFWALSVLSAMLGHIGKVGGGLEFSLGYGSSGGDIKIAPKLKSLPSIPSEKYTNENSPWVKNQNYTIPSSRSIEALLNPGKIIDQNGKKIKLPRMRVAYNASGSMLTRHQDVNNIIKALKNLDTIITAEPYWTSMAKMSDIVLPVAIEPERTDIVLSGASSEYLFAIRPIVSPAGESKSDFEICRLICEKWGMQEVFTEGKNELEWVRYIYEDAINQAKNLGYESLPSFEEFWQKGYIKFDKTDEDSKFYTRLSEFRKNPNKNRLGTPSGKIEIFSPAIEKMNYDDCKAHPVWLEPFEWLGKKDKKYPIAIVSPHSRFRLHSQLNNSIIRNFAEINAREPMIINPKTAQKRNIKDGDVVRIFNDRGEILCGALLSDIVQEDVVIVCEGAWYDPKEYGKKSLCQHGCVNVLTKDKGCSKLSQSNTAHTSLVEVEKYKGAIEEIRAFSKPKIINA